jgi:hypothetical protein
MDESTAKPAQRDFPNLVDSRAPAAAHLYEQGLCINRSTSSTRQS